MTFTSPEIPVIVAAACRCVTTIPERNYGSLHLVSQGCISPASYRKDAVPWGRDQPSCARHPPPVTVVPRQVWGSCQHVWVEASRLLLQATESTDPECSHASTRGVLKAATEYLLYECMNQSYRLRATTRQIIITQSCRSLTAERAILGFWFAKKLQINGWDLRGPSMFLVYSPWTGETRLFAAQHGSFTATVGR